MEKLSYEDRVTQLGNWVAGMSKKQYLRENVPLCWARFAVLDVILPEIAFAMAERHAAFLERREALDIVEACLEKCWPKCVLVQYGFFPDGNATRMALKEAGTEWILADLIKQVEILEESDAGYLYFPDAKDRILFTVMAMSNRFVMAADRVTTAAEHLRFLDERVWPDAVLELLGNAMGVDEAPCKFENCRWNRELCWKPEFAAVWDLFRRHEQNRFLKVFRTEDASNAHYAEENLIRILRLCMGSRDKKTSAALPRVDVSGIDFSRMDLSGVDLFGMVFSHPFGANGLYANLEDTDIGIQNLDGSLKEKGRKEHILTQAANGVILFSVESSGHIFLEEREESNGDVWPVGCYEQIQWVKYHETMPLLCVAEEREKDEKTELRVHLYNRKNGRRDVYSAVGGELLAGKWHGEKLVLLVQTERGTAERVSLWYEDGVFQIAGKELLFMPRAKERFEILSEDQIGVFDGSMRAVIDVETNEVHVDEDDPVVASWSKPADEEAIQETILAWVAPVRNEARLALLDAKKRVLYLYQVGKEQELICTDFVILQSQDVHVQAICVEEKSETLLVCDHEKISFYDLVTGEKIDRRMPIPLPREVLDWGKAKNTNPGKFKAKVKLAEFAPGGESLELQMIYCDRTGYPQRLVEAWFGWNFVTGEVVMREQTDGKQRFEKYTFDADDMMEGKDSGRRYLVKSKADVCEHRMRNARRYEEDENADDRMYPRLKAVLEQIQRRQSGRDWENKAGVQIVFSEKLCGYLGKTERKKGEHVNFFVLDKESGAVECYKDRVPTMLAEQWEFYPFEGGFIARDGLDVVRFVREGKTMNSLWSFDHPEFWMVGCCGVEHIREEKMHEYVEQFL